MGNIIRSSFPVFLFQLRKIYLIFLYPGKHQAVIHIHLCPPEEFAYDYIIIIKRAQVYPAEFFYGDVIFFLQGGSVIIQYYGPFCP